MHPGPLLSPLPPSSTRKGLDKTLGRNQAKHPVLVQLTPGKSPHHGGGVDGARWSLRWGTGGDTAWPPALSCRGTGHVSSIFGGGTPGARDAPSGLFASCGFRIAGHTCSMPKDTQAVNYDLEH